MTSNSSVNKMGVLNIYKEPGYTSHDVVAIVRRTIGIKRVGHTGTLDPNAEGVLPICIGSATRLADYLAAENKTYVADLVLGITTDTGDISGNILTRHDGDLNVDSDVIENILTSFLGDQLQIPPMYSAIKMGGKKLYELARKGVTVERKPRPVCIHHIKVVDKIPEGYRIEVACSKGTYIRSLCMDIGEKLGCGGTMGKLVRTQSGQFLVNHAKKLDEIKYVAAHGQLQTLILPIDKVLPYPTCHVKPEGLARAINGNPLPVALVDGQAPEKCWLFGDGRIIGLYAKPLNKSDELRPEVML